jgi:4-hydroxybenzoate polyprenyltransferase
MKLIVAFFRLVRSLNLLFIVLTQVLFQYCIVIPSLKANHVQPTLSPLMFSLLVLASVTIAAAGYIINDYFDLNIDRVNKPEKLVVDKIIKRRWAILWHFCISLFGGLLSLYLAWRLSNLVLALGNLLCIALLWFYSTTFKKKLLIGNIIISLLTAWVVLVLWVIELPRLYYDVVPEELDTLSRVFKLAALYGGFAFISSLIREVVKDIEDMAGDSKYGARTMPIVWGVNVSKVFAATWTIVLIAAILILQLYVLPFRWWWSLLYSGLLIILPLLIILRKLYKAYTSKDFHQISNWIKFVMLTGILSMIFFKIYS